MARDPSLFLKRDLSERDYFQRKIPHPFEEFHPVDRTSIALIIGKMKN